jgi:hypothetical protein
MDYELGIIEKKGYASYFLIVADLLQASLDSILVSSLSVRTLQQMGTILSSSPPLVDSL